MKLFGEPYTLDDEQLAAVKDLSKNTLVIARAGSGKTRVIVAKVVFLVAKCGLTLDQIKVFMFNRTAALEVNQRISAVEVSGKKLTSNSEANGIKVASTFHKFAYDLLKHSGEKFTLVDEETEAKLIEKALIEVLEDSHLKRPRSRDRYQGLLDIATSFVVRAGQKYPEEIPKGDYKLFNASERLGAKVYACYKSLLRNSSKNLINFNMLMNQAATLLEKTEEPTLRNLKYLMIDEYQDFSYLFLRVVEAVRKQAEETHLFAVGDDWQAINRFAGSNVDYFLSFETYFPENCQKLPIATNYRSKKRIVETANHFMLENYDPSALPARAFNTKNGKIKSINYLKTKFNAEDLLEDGLKDGEFLKALARTTNLDAQKIKVDAAKLLKTCYKIVKKHRNLPIMILHRHNFTSFLGISLDNFVLSLKEICLDNFILTEEEFQQNIRAMTMHKSKGLEAEVVILLEFDHSLLFGSHPHAELFPSLGDSRAQELADQERLVYVALTRAKSINYLLTSDQSPLLKKPILKQ